MGKIISGLILGFVIAVVAAGIYAFTKKPKVLFDAQGFPLNPKPGDTFTKGGKLYTFNNGVWTTEEGGTNGGNGGGDARYGICSNCASDWAQENCPNCSGKASKCPDWNGRDTVRPIPVGQIAPVEIQFDVKGLNVICPPCIIFQGATYYLVSSQTYLGYKRCFYKR